MGWTSRAVISPHCDTCGRSGFDGETIWFDDRAHAERELKPQGWRFGKPVSPNDPGTVTCRQCVLQAEVPAEASAFMAGYAEGLRHG